MRSMRLRICSSGWLGSGGAFAFSRLATLKRSRSFSLSSSSVNSLALRNMPKNSWLFWAGSSSFAMAVWPDSIALLRLHRGHLALQEGVLQGDAGLVDEGLQGVQPAQGA